MDTTAIIENAAKKAGKPLPLDDYDREFGEGLLRSLGYAMDLVHGRRKPSGRNFFAEHAKLMEEAEALRNGQS